MSSGVMVLPRCLSDGARRGVGARRPRLQQVTATPVTFFVVPHRGATVAKFGMTSCPCLSNDPGGGVAEPGDVDGPLIGTGPPVCIEHRAGLFVTWVPGVDV
ncbi:hypothetical protein ACN94_05895 [Gordonia paraffinivorans]|nr:hypothetical protein [Gordonia paraffinivorans]